MIGKFALLALAAAAVFAVLYVILRNPNKNARLLVAAIAVVAIGAPLLYALQLYTAHELASRYVSEIGRAFGLSSYWSAAIAALSVVPILVALRLLFSLSAERRLAGKIVLTLGLAAYWGSLGLATSDHMVAADGGRLKCYAINQDGVRFFEQQQIDPRTGETCRWIDASNVQTVLAIDRKLKSGARLKRLEFDTMAEVRFFAPGTAGAVPLVWYYRGQDSAYEFFDTPGPHPIFGEPLKPVTPEVARDWASQAEFRVEVPDAQNAHPSVVANTSNPDGRVELGSLTVGIGPLDYELLDGYCTHVTGKNRQFVEVLSADGPRMERDWVTLKSRTGKPVTIELIAYPWRHPKCSE